MTITQDELEKGLEDLLSIAADMLTAYNNAITKRKNGAQEVDIEPEKVSVHTFGTMYKQKEDELLTKAGPELRGQLHTFISQYIMQAPTSDDLTYRNVFFGYIQLSTVFTFWHTKPGDSNTVDALYLARQCGNKPITSVISDSMQQTAVDTIQSDFHAYQALVDAIKTNAPPPASQAAEPISSLGNETENIAYYYVIANRAELTSFSAKDRVEAKEKYASLYNNLIAAGFTPDRETPDHATMAKGYVDNLTGICLGAPIPATTPKKDIGKIVANIVKNYNDSPDAKVYGYSQLVKSTKESQVKSEIPDKAKTTTDPEQIQAQINTQKQIIVDADTAMQLSNGNVTTKAYKQSEATKKDAQEKIAALELQLKGKTVVTPATNNQEVANLLENENGSNNLKASEVGTAKITGTTSTTDGAAPKVEIDSSVFDDSPKVLDLGLKLTFDDPVSKRYFALDTTNPTQLFVEDPIDFRAVQMVKPFFTSGHTSSYFRLMNDPLTAKPAEFINSGKEQPTLKNPFGSGAIYNQFFIKRLDETHSEKFQLTDTISSGQALFSFGEKPEFWTIQGQLINDSLNNWLTKFREAWKHYLRISKLVEHGQFLRIALPAIRLTVDCYPVALSLSHADESESISTFSMQFFVKDWTSWSNINLSINDGTTAYLNSMLSMLSVDSKKSSKTAGAPDSNAKIGTQEIHQIGDTQIVAPIKNITKKK
jgi:hypothetical protein